MTIPEYIQHLTDLYRRVSMQAVSNSTALMLLHELKANYDLELHRMDVEYCHKLGVLWD